MKLENGEEQFLELKKTQRKGRKTIEKNPKIEKNH